MELETPELVAAEAREGAPAKLRGGRCSACGRIFFPPYTYGCERCGAPPEALEGVLLGSEGVVRAAIRVHRTAGGRPQAVASIELDGGPVVRAVLADADPLPRPGTRVSAIVSAKPGSPERLALRFRTGA